MWERKYRNLVKAPGMKIFKKSRASVEFSFFFIMWNKGTFVVHNLYLAFSFMAETNEHGHVRCPKCFDPEHVNNADPAPKQNLSHDQSLSDPCL